MKLLAAINRWLERRTARLNQRTAEKVQRLADELDKR